MPIKEDLRDEPQFFDNKTEYYFIQDLFEYEYDHNPNILNMDSFLFNNEQQLINKDIDYSNMIQINQRPYFYTEIYQKVEIMDKPVELVKKIRIIFQKLKGLAIKDDGSGVDYSKMANLQEYKEHFLKYLSFLPYINIEQLIQEENIMKTFFINLYNILNIHSVIAHYQLTGNYNINRKTFYDQYKYNIGGINFSLNDIEHGILRNNDSIGLNKLKFYWKVFMGQSLTDKTQPRYRKENTKRKFVTLKNLDPRIHFALNCGAKSCPPIRVYEADQVEKQLNLAAQTFVNSNIEILQQSNKKSIKLKLSKIFSWYLCDFGETQIQALQYLSQFCDEPLKTQLLKIIQDNLQFTIEYEDYDWNVNGIQ